MAAKTDYAEKAVLDWILLGATPTRPSAVFLALHTADPGETAATGELGAGIGYARISVTFAAGTSGAGTAASSNAQLYTASGAGFGAVTHASLWDAVTAGNALYKGALTASKTVAAGDQLNFAAGAIVVTEA